VSNEATVETEAWLEDFLTGLLERSGLDLSVIEIALDEEGRGLTVQLDGPDKALAIGRDGQMLSSLQLVVNAAAANAGLARGRLVLDVDGYLAERDENLRRDAIRLAAEAIESEEPIDFEPMPPRQRRLVHLAVADIDGVTTESVGQGEDRLVRLVPDP
jgi:spoIIIJ-associated protein